MKSSVRKTSSALVGSLALAAVVAVPGRAELVAHPKQAGTSIDVGQAFKDDGKTPLTRTGVYLTTGGVYDKKFEVLVTLGGLFWYSFPEFSTEARLVRFGPGVGQAQAIYSFGDPDEPSAKLSLGLFPFKYNPYSRNLGEYLYRSGAYPSYIWTGGWSFINSSGYLAQGVKLQVPMFGGSVTNDFTLFMERDAIVPIHDFSPGWVLTAKAGSAFELGAGAVWQNALSLDPDRLAPKVRDNAYSKVTKMPVIGSTDPATLDSANWDYYTFKGVKLMGRAGLDLGALIGSESLKPRSFALYGEVALLGVKNQPYFYERRSERMPIMAGINLPTFGLLDQLSFEAEYFKNRYPNTIYYPFDSQDGLPLPLGDAGDEALPTSFSDSSFAANKKRYTKDDWKWSLFLSRKITDGITIHAQAASDHFRPFNVEAKPINKPFTETPSDWYYVVRLDFGLF